MTGVVVGGVSGAACVMFVSLYFWFMRDGGAHQAPRSSGLHLPAGNGAGRQQAFPPLLPAPPALHHERALSAEDAATVAFWDALTAEDTLVTHADTALWPGHREPWFYAATYEEACQSRAGELGITDGQWPWLAEGQFGHCDDPPGVA
jgi:hypothetical protein